MPWTTPSLREVRMLVRDSIRASLPGADASVPNSVLRVMSDNQGALCHLTLQYVDWLALQLLPDTSETEWLDRHGHIWLTNADGTTGRKLATLAKGIASFTGPPGLVIPSATQFAYGAQGYETITDITLGSIASEGAIRALDAGTAGNLEPGTALGTLIDGLSVIVVLLDGGTDTENDNDLRGRVLRRIRQPPMGGAAYDYEAWALAVPGVTRAWCAGTEQGIGTAMTRIMMDDLRADNGGFPLPTDCETVLAYIQTVRPVTVKDIFVEAPIPFPINHHISFLNVDTPSTRAAIEQSLLKSFFVRSVPSQHWFRAWSDEAIANAQGVRAYVLELDELLLPGGGFMPVLGDLTFG